MGNLCTQGGANVVCGCKDAAVESWCRDNGDGTYLLEWQSDKSGIYHVTVTIDGVHAIGSPAAMRLVSGTPDFGRTLLDGAGLSSAIAGKVSSIRIQCLDACGNPTLPASNMRFGLALMPAAESTEARGGTRRSTRWS